MPEERLAVVLRRAQVLGGGAHRVVRRERLVGLLDQAVGELRPPAVPAVAIARRDLRRDVQALTHVRHASVTLSDAALQLPVEADVVEEKLHDRNLMRRAGLGLSAPTSGSSACRQAG
jgi:hypothetical protein